MAPETFLRVLGPKPYRVGYAQPSRQPRRRPLRREPQPPLQNTTQFQLILKPPPVNVQELYLESLEALGIDLKKHDPQVRGRQLGDGPRAAHGGVGWQVMLDGPRNHPSSPTSSNAAASTSIPSAPSSPTASNVSPPSSKTSTPSTTSSGPRDPETGKPVTYGEVRLAEELQFSVYNFEMADVPSLWDHFNRYEAEGKSLLSQADALLASETATARGEEALPAAAHIRARAQVLPTSSTSSTPAAPSASPSASASSAASAPLAVGVAKALGRAAGRITEFLGKGHGFSPAEKHKLSFVQGMTLVVPMTAKNKTGL